jgi:hypothetical protein
MATIINPCYASFPQNFTQDIPERIKFCSSAAIEFSEVSYDTRCILPTINNELHALTRRLIPYVIWSTVIVGKVGKDASHCCRSNVKAREFSSKLPRKLTTEEALVLVLSDRGYVAGAGSFVRLLAFSPDEMQARYRPTNVARIHLCN